MVICSTKFEHDQEFSTRKIFGVQWVPKCDFFIADGKLEEAETGMLAFSWLKCLGYAKEVPCQTGVPSSLCFEFAA